MPDLDFQIETAEVVAHAAVPTLAFRLRIHAGGPERISAVFLRCQIQIEPPRRTYDESEQKRLLDLFGAPARWGHTLRPMLWTYAMVPAPAFESTTVVDIPVGCTFDFNAAATKYFYGLEGGEIPLCFLFSGTVFYDAGGSVQAAQIPWDKEARYRLAVRVWREMMNMYYPNSACLFLHRDVFDRLYEYKMCEGIATFEDALDRILPAPKQRAAR